MRQRRLGAQGPDVGTLGLGCMGMTTAYDTNERDDEESVRVIYRAVELGPGWRSPIFDFEVGSMYGASAHVLEELLLLYASVERLPFPEPRLTDEIPWQ